MNTRQLAAALATTVLAITGSSAFATEAQQFNPPASTLSRAQVVGELKTAIARGEVVSYGEAEQNVDRVATTSTRDRKEVKAEARYASRHHVITDYTIGG